MSNMKYLYIDDEPGDPTSAIKDGLNDTGIIEVILKEAERFEQQLSIFENELNEYDGLI